MKQIVFSLFLIMLASSCKDANLNNTVVVTADTMLKSVPKVDSDSIPEERRRIKFTSKYNFETFKAKPFFGKPVSPDFTGNEFKDDEEYVKFISDGCKKQDINFGGHYTIIQKSCGAMCSHIFIIDRRSGEIHDDIGLVDGRYGYMYKKDSYLLLANAFVFEDDSLNYYSDSFAEPEFYVWKDSNFQLLEY